MNTDTPETDKNLDGREVIDRIYRERDEEREETIRWMSIAEGRNAKDVAAAEFILCRTIESIHPESKP
jgi:hypothetical protein